MVEIKKDIPLSEFSSYRIGGPARFFCEAKNISEIGEAIQFAKDKNLPVFILGGGTNLLIRDQGFDGLVLKPSLDFIEKSTTGLRVGAGALMEKVLTTCIEYGLTGLEWAGGLPGTLGGAVRGNAGAFSGEIKDVIQSIDSLNIETLAVTTRTREECGFGYRMSIFKMAHANEIVLTAELQLGGGDSERIREAIEEKIRYRWERHPMEYPNIGSIFKNVPLERVAEAAQERFRSVVKSDPFPVVPTAYLIAEAGLKGVSHGDATVSPKHPNFIVNTGAASANDVQSLITLVKTEVRNKFSIELEEEVTIV